MKKKIFVTFFIFIALASASLATSSPIDIKYEDGIYHIILDGNKVGKRLSFVADQSLVTNKEMHKKSGSILTVNAGYFDPKNQKTISYIVTDRTTSEDPLLNENLLGNYVLRQNIDKITNRTEFRVVQCDDNKYHYEIVPHKSPVDFACTIITSAQGGPMILPELRLEEEFFIVKKDDKIVRESASVLEKVARTVIGLKDNEIHILIITNENPMTIYEVRDLCQKLGLERAMGFDGGSSTSMNYKNTIDVVSTSDAGGRMLKSFLLFK